MTARFSASPSCRGVSLSLRERDGAAKRKPDRAKLQEKGPGEGFGMRQSWPSFGAFLNASPYRARAARRHLLPKGEGRALRFFLLISTRAVIDRPYNIE